MQSCRHEWLQYCDDHTNAEISGQLTTLYAPLPLTVSSSAWKQRWKMQDWKMMVHRPIARLEKKDEAKICGGPMAFRPVLMFLQC